MKLEVSLKINPIDTLGVFQALDIIPDLSSREVRIDGKLVPQGLADIILLGLDVATDKYCDYIEQMRKEGHFF